MEIAFATRFANYGVRNVKTYRAVTGIGIGAAGSVAAYFFLSRHGFNSTTSIGMAAAFAIICGLSAALSVTFRCCTALCIPQLASRVGRLSLYSLLISTLLMNPIMSIQQNWSEMLRVGNCASNVSESHIKLVKKTFGDTYKGIADSLQQNMNHLNQITDAVDAMVAPFAKAMQNMRNDIDGTLADIYEAEKDCGNGVGDTYDDCIRRTQEAKRDCEARVNDRFLARIACAPVELARQTCELLEKKVLCLPVRGAAEIVGLARKISLFGNQLQQFADSLKLKLNRTAAITESTNVKEVIADFKSNIESKYEEYSESIRRGAGYANILSGWPCAIAIPLRAFFLLRTMIKKKRDPNAESGRLTTIVCWLLGISDVVPKADLVTPHTKKRVLDELKTMLSLSTVPAFFLIMSSLAFFLEYLISLGMSESVTSVGDKMVVMNAGIDVGAVFEGGPLMVYLANSILTTFSLKRQYNISIDPSICLPNTVPPCSYDVYFLVFGIIVGIYLLSLTDHHVSRKLESVIKFFFPEEFIPALNVSRVTVYPVWLNSPPTELPGFALVPMHQSLTPTIAPVIRRRHKSLNIRI